MVSAADENSAFLLIREGRFYYRIWFVPGDRRDWMAAVWRDVVGGDGLLHLDYRFRYHADSDPWSRDDHKSVWRATSPFDPARLQHMLETVEKMVAGMVELGFGCTRDQVTTLIPNSDDPKVIFPMILACPWANARGVGPDA